MTRKNQFIEGTVKGFNERIEQKGKYSPEFLNVWTFRLECDKASVGTTSVPVEMRGRKYNGFIQEGDTIRLLSKWKGGMHYTKEVFSVTNNAKITAKRGASLGVKIYTGFFFIALFVVLAIVVTNN